MKVLFDFDIFQRQKFGGISRLFCDNLKNFNSSGDVQWNLPIQYSQNEYLKNDLSLGVNSLPLDHQYQSFLGGREFKGKSKLYNLSNKFNTEIDCYRENVKSSLNAIKSGDFDIFHPTYYDDYYVDAIGNKKMVLTVFDMIHELFPELFHLGDPVPAIKKKLVHRADRIISISESTKKDLVDVYGMDPGKIDVVHLSTSFGKYSKNVLQELKPSYNYILFTGNRNLYKNFYSLLYAVAPILRKNPDLKLLCTGPSFTKSELSLFKNLEVGNNLKHKFATDLELESLYTFAEVFVFPSYYEGFGIPILESFACECPTLCSNVGSLPEVAGDGALYFSPKEYSEIHDQVSNLLWDTKLKDNLVSKGTSRLSSFSSEKTARETENVYKSLL